MKNLRLAAASAIATVALLVTPGVFSQTLSTALSESVEMVTLPGTSTALETTFYKPPGNGPFPLVVINHGKEEGRPSDQSRFRPAVVARYFLSRGYAVVAPMRQGMAGSEGWFAGRFCDLHRNLRAEIRDVSGILDHLRTIPWADTSRVLVAGHSEGGLTALAFGAQAHPGVKGLVSFAGGIRIENCTSWEYNLIEALKDLAAQTTAPSLWIFGENDSAFGHLYESMRASYQAAGGKAELVTIRRAGANGHGLIYQEEAASEWQAPMTRFLQQIGMPHEELQEFAHFASAPTSERPKASGFAALHEVEKVPHLRMFGRRAYRSFLDLTLPRAFAVASDGGYGWAYGPRAAELALEKCSKNTRTSCRLYAVDHDVVWLP